MNHTNKLSGLYAITPAIQNTEVLLAQVNAAIKGGARLVQYRNKEATPQLQQQQAQALQQLCHAQQVLLIINDDPSLAKIARADGVHLGQSDMAITSARELLGEHAIIGVTCHGSLALAEIAANRGADYLSFGRFFPSRTKPHAPSAPLAILKQAKQQFHLPIAAIGGVSIESAALLIHSGADMLAVCAEIFA